ncbi:type II toxin-antitoxin system YafQ family toxin [Patescibacteria group bacterium]|nr:type II toxin-antitoxin system YafQ family toxin [Patescibacteria group bacterium]
MQKNNYSIVETKSFKRDLKRIKKMGRYDIEKLKNAVILLASGSNLPDKLHNHKLHGKWSGFEECHIEPDWLLVYKKDTDKLILFLMRTGRHSDVFG